jgi:NAD(P)-dependent dehydrogenase (short-subunit alcohol dehydrogenase family)
MGESTARRLAEAGCDVAVIDLDAGRAERVAADVKTSGRRGIALSGDLMKDGAATKLFETVRAELKGELDVLVSVIGGVASGKPLLDMSATEWDADQQLNLRYFFFAAQAFAKSLVASGKPGAITCIGSVSGIRGAPFHASYGAAKAGLMALVRSMAVEWAPHHIRVNAIAPGTIITPRLPDSEDSRTKIAASLIPMRRRGTTDEIGKAAVFLSSDLASYVTGHTLLVDGGWMSAFLLARPTASGS